MKILAEPLLHQNSSLIFLAWETLGRPPVVPTFCCSSIGILHGHFFASTGQILPRQQDK